VTAVGTLQRARHDRGVPLRVALVLWHGGVGGAERFTNALAASLREAGVDAYVVYVGDPRPTCAELELSGVPFLSFGAVRGREIVRRPRAFASLLGDADVALLQTAGFLPAAIRCGGYRGRLVAVEHGALPDRRPGVVRVADRRTGTWALDAQVAVTDHAHAELLRRSHAPRVERIYGGIDVRRFVPGSARGDAVTVGFAGRLHRGKGVHHLLAAVAGLSSGPVRLVVAGDGPEREALERLASELQLAERVRFAGRLDDMPAFWRSCDIAVVPSIEPEGAGMVALEAAACAKPVVATAMGGLAELVADGVTGTLVPDADVPALARALDAYVADARLREEHGAAGHRRCLAEFALERCAGDYIEMFASLVGVSP
jgi:glycosyltransferase involved in cell wall biosynthesis